MIVDSFCYEAKGYMPSVDLPLIGRVFQVVILKDKNNSNHLKDASKSVSLIKK